MSITPRKKASGEELLFKKQISSYVSVEVLHDKELCYLAFVFENSKDKNVWRTMLSIEKSELLPQRLQSSEELEVLLERSLKANPSSFPIDIKDAATKIAHEFSYRYESSNENSENPAILRQRYQRTLDRVFNEQEGIVEKIIDAPEVLVVPEDLTKVSSERGKKTAKARYRIHMARFESTSLPSFILSEKGKSYLGWTLVKKIPALEALDILKADLVTADLKMLHTSIRTAYGLSESPDRPDPATLQKEIDVAIQNWRVTHPEVSEEEITKRRRILMRALRVSGLIPSELAAYVSSHLYKPVEIEDIGFIFQKGFWRNYAPDLVQYKCKKDPDIALTFEATLPRGIVMRYNPHMFQFANSGVGKTEGYKIIGKHEARTTPKALIGATGKDGLKQGIMNGWNYSILFDQIESQDEDIQHAQYLLDYMETGNIREDIGAYGLYAESLATLIFSGNLPMGMGEKPEDFTLALKRMLMHVQLAEATGRRIALWIFGNDYMSVVFDTDAKPLGSRGEDEQRYKQMVMLYRLIEEHPTVLPKMQELYRKPEVAKWLETPDETYKDKVTQIAAGINLEAAIVYRMMLAHATQGQCHLRGAALNIVRHRYLPEIVSDTMSVEDILAKADEFFQELCLCNLRSFKRLADKGPEIVAEYLRGLKLPKTLLILLDTFQRFRKETGRERASFAELERYHVPNPENTYEWSETLAHLRNPRQFNLNRYADTLLWVYKIIIDLDAETILHQGIPQL